MARVIFSWFPFSISDDFNLPVAISNSSVDTIPMKTIFPQVFVIEFAVELASGGAERTKELTGKSERVRLYRFPPPGWLFQRNFPHLENAGSPSCT